VKKRYGKQFINMVILMESINSNKEITCNKKITKVNEEIDEFEDE
jgi:hypothetical protein